MMAMLVSVFAKLIAFFQVFVARAASAFFNGVKLGALTVLISSLAVSALADDEDDQDVRITDMSNKYDFKKLGGMDSRFSPHGDDLMGDMIDKNSGGISFEHLDVSLPGNSGLEVAIRRKRSQGNPSFSPSQNGFGDWIIDLPIAYVAYADEPGGQSPVFDGGCLNTTGMISATATAGSRGGSLDISNEVHASGSVLHVPGKGLSGYEGSVKTPSDPKSDWTSGARSTDYAGRCATVVIAPDGTKYKFGRHVFRRAKYMEIPHVYTQCTGRPVSRCIDHNAQLFLDRKHAVYLITEVEDVNGNWVRYDYTNDSRAEVTRIYSNDGRDIRVYYSSAVPLSHVRNSRSITRVTTNGRSWTYGYVGSVHHSPLHKVTLPDGRFWRFGDTHDGIGEMTREPHTYYKCVPYDLTFDMKHPDGAIGTFRLRETRHLKGATTVGSTNGDSIGHYMKPTTIANYTSLSATANDICLNGTPFPSGGVKRFELPYQRPVGWPVYQAMSVASKTISGSGIPTAKWDFKYRNYSGGALDNNWTEITGPDGTKRTYTHRAVGRDFGLLKSIHVTPASGAGETITYQHNHHLFGDGAPGGNYGREGCVAEDLNPEGAIAGLCEVFRKRPVTQMVHQRDGDTFTTDYL